MLGRIQSRLNHATVIAYVALFVALGGSSYAAVKISGKNIKNETIAGKKLKNRTITRGKVKKKTLTGTEIRDGSLLGKNFKAGELPAGPPGKDGPSGKDGSPGREGTPGQEGAPGATNVVVRTVQACPTLPSGVHCSIPIQCQPGERATGGGAGFTDFAGNEVLDVSHPLEADGTNPEPGDVPTGWFAGIKFSGGGPRSAIGYVICASP